METENASTTSVTVVSFRISSPELDTAYINQILDLFPDHTHSKGDHPRNNPKYSSYKQGMWVLNSKLSNAEFLSAHLESLLTVLEPKEQQILKLSENNVIGFYATLFSQAGFELSPQLMRRIVALNATLGITVYSSDEFAGGDALPIQRP